MASKVAYLSRPAVVVNRQPAIPKDRDFKFSFFSVFNMSMSFGKTLSHTKGDYKNAKTCRQHTSLTEKKTEFSFFEIPIIPSCLVNLVVVVVQVSQQIFIVQSGQYKSNKPNK